ncbi:MAG: hypothetical protein QNK30_17305, partial [Bacteroidales bacterium]|nr:hypothetical protein [Bacteroidales bacterium]
MNLLNGTCTATTCDGFRQGFYNLASNVLNIPNLQYRSIGPIINGGYLTRPGTAVIDGHWVGNVRTEQQAFAQLQVFKFSEHHFLTYGGRICDPTANMMFNNESDMKWCTYTLENNASVQANFKNLRVFRVTAGIPGAPPCNYQYLVEIGASGGWPTNLLVTGNNLNAGNDAGRSKPYLSRLYPATNYVQSDHGCIHLKPAERDRLFALGHLHLEYGLSYINTMKDFKNYLLISFCLLSLLACSNTQLRWSYGGSVSSGANVLQTELQNFFVALPVDNGIFLAGYKIDEQGINYPYIVFVDSDINNFLRLKSAIAQSFSEVYVIDEETWTTNIRKKNENVGAYLRLCRL